MMAELMRCRVQRLIMLLILGFTVAGSSADAGTARSHNYDATPLASSSDITGSLSLPSQFTCADAAVAEEEEEEVVVLSELELPGGVEVGAPDGAEAALVEMELEPSLDPAANAFVLICAILVITMSVPGIALFYGGLVRAKNVLSIMEQSLVFFSLSFVLWLVAGYSLSFGSASELASASGLSDYLHLIVGDFNKAFLSGISFETLSGAISEYNFVIFQGAFCGIASLLIVGATVERIKFSALMLALWKGWWSKV